MAKISASAQDPRTSAPVRSTRQTRSMSAEPVENARPSSSTGRTAQGRSDGQRSSRTRKGVRKPRSRPAPPDLTTVEEDLEVEGEAGAADDDDDDDAALQAHAQAQAEQAGLADSPRERRLSIAASAISETTAKTSFSEEELELLDPEIMLGDLPKLAVAASDLEQLLLPEGSETQPGTWSEVKRIGSKPNRHHQHRLRALNMYKQSFGTMPYIRPNLVLRGLLSTPDVTELPHARWRPDNILLKINLATMLNSILITCDIDNWTSQCSTALEQLFIAFPACIAGGEFPLPALKIYLNLTAQVVIAHLEALPTSAPTFSPHETIDDSFFDGQGVFKHMNALGLSRLSDADRGSAFVMVEQLAQALKAPFEEGSTKDATAGIGILKANFRWHSFQELVVRYAHARSAQLEQSIAQAGGIDQIVAGLSQEVQRWEEEKYVLTTKRKSLEAKRKSLTSNSNLQNLMSSFPVIRKIAAFAEDDQPESAIPQIVPESTVVGRELSFLPQDHADPGELSKAPESAAALAEDAELEAMFPQIVPATTLVDPESLFVPQDDVEDPGELSEATGSSAAPRSSRQLALGIQELQRQNAVGQQRRLIDPQSNAQRMHFDDDEELQSQRANSRPTARPGSQFRVPGSSARIGRSAAEMEDDDDVPDPTQDEGFQSNTRSKAGAARLWSETSFAPTNRGSASAEPITADPGPSSRQSTAPRASLAKRPRKNPGSSIPPPLPRNEQSQPDEDRRSLYERAKVTVKRDRITARTTKLPRSRRPWTDEEEARLIDLIEQNGDDGVSYVSIKQIDANDENPKLEGRSAEDIRFKARNMKATLVLAGAGLPDNWDKVVLDKKSIDKIHARGIEYHQERQRQPITIDFSN